MLHIEREMPFLIPHFCERHVRGNEERLAEDLFKGAKTLFSENVLRNLLHSLEANFAKPQNGEITKDGEQDSLQQTTAVPENNEKTDSDTTASKELKSETAAHSSKQFPAFVDLLQRVEEVFQQRHSERSSHSNQPNDIICAEHSASTKNQNISNGKHLDKQCRKECNSKMQIKASDFKPEDIIVKIKDGYVTIEALREERDDENGTFRMHKLNKTYKLPTGADPDKVTCEMTDEGLLTIKTPLPKPSENLHERILTILQEKDMKEEEAT